MDNLGDRMKTYEKAFSHILPIRMPVIVRLDGKAFHTLTRNIEPFDDKIQTAMNATSLKLCEEMQNAVFAYSQSDEISILMHPYKKLESEPWFGNDLAKIVSITAAIASTTFSQVYSKIAYFDSRVFVLPEADVCNYFVWRQKDWIRNSVQMLARSLYSHNQLLNKNTEELHELIFMAGKNWADLPLHNKNGIMIIKNPIWEWQPASIFTQNRSLIEDLLKINQEST